jgi:hypothetical protein
MDTNRITSRSETVLLNEAIEVSLAANARSDLAISWPPASATPLSRDALPAPIPPALFQLAWHILDNMDALSDEALDQLAGGLNPQPLPSHDSLQ